MATDIVQGLFGMTPESYQQQRDAEAYKRAAAFGQMEPMQAARTSIYYGANQLGGAIGGMLGAEDPQLVRIRQQQQVLSGLDVTNLDSIAEATMRANQMGNPQLALQLTALGDKVLERQDLSLQRQDKLQQRLLAEQALIDKQNLSRVMSMGFTPGQKGGELLGQEGTAVTPTIAPSFDINRIADLLKVIPGGTDALTKQLDLKKKELELSEPNLAIETIYNESTGREQKVTINKRTGEVVNLLGGQKSKDLKYQDIGDSVIGVDESGKEVVRFRKTAAPQGAPSMQIMQTADGDYIGVNPKTLQANPVTMGGEPVKGKGTDKFTEIQVKSAGFFDRMNLAESIVTNKSNVEKPGFFEPIYTAIPFIGESVANILPSKIGGLSTDRQQYLQAANNFIRANLRLESGAAIGKDEWLAEYKNYYPVPGDSEAVIRQKESMRKVLVDNMKRNAGPALGASATPVTPKRSENPADVQRNLSTQYPGIILNPKLQKALNSD